MTTPVRSHGHVEIVPAHQGEAVLGHPQGLVVEPVTDQRHPGGLVDRVDAVDLGGGLDDPVDLCPGRVEVVRTDPSHAQRRVSVFSTAGTASADGAGSLVGSTKRYPTLRTVPIRVSCSGPSLARRRRTWTSTVRVPPK